MAESSCHRIKKPLTFQVGRRQFANPTPVVMN